MKYDHVRESLRTGDPVGFSGEGAVSEITKRITKSRFSHVGIVYRSRLDGRHDCIFIVESTSICSRIDVIHGERIRGLQMHILSDRIRDYGCRCWIARVRPSVREATPAADTERANAFMMNALRLRIPYDTIQALGCAIDWWDRFFENEEDWSALFCSEWVSVYHELRGWLPKSVNTSEQTPEEAMTWEHLDPYIAVQL